MNNGYIYLLQNRAFGAYVIKIGRTKKKPDIRAKEIYDGATGIPLPFDLAIAFSTSDCLLAEKNIHTKLKPYRINNRREFFCTSPSVASTIAFEECSAVNRLHGAPLPEEFSFPSSELLHEESYTPGPIDQNLATSQTFKIRIDELKVQPVGTSTLNDQQLDRARIVGMILERVFPSSAKEWQDDFSRDRSPEREIRIWEEIAKAFMSVDQVHFATDDQRWEAFQLLLERSMKPRSQVLEEFPLRYFSKDAANRLLKQYKLKPKPFVVSIL